MPKTLQYSKNAVIYFRGKVTKEIFLISQGSISVSGDDNTGKRVLSKGEFFGLFSAIGDYPRQEDAVSLTDVVLLSFSVKEFEDLVASKPRLALQLMQMLSQELRKVHKKTQQILDAPSGVSLANGLFSYAKMYHKQGDMRKTKYILKRYLECHPNHDHVDEAKQLLSEIEEQG